MGRMMLDTATAGNVDWPLAYQQLWGRYLALSDALEAERERVRVFVEAISRCQTISAEIEAYDESGDDGHRRDIELGILWDEAWARLQALATAGEEGATT